MRTLRLCALQKERSVRIVAVSTVQEEVGLHGAEMIAASLRPDVALVTDVGHATDSPGISQPQHGQFKLGAGPKIAIGGALQPEVVARLLATADRIYLSNKKGTTTVIAPGREYKELATNQLDGEIWASPAVAGDSLILRTKTHLYRIAEKK